MAELEFFKTYTSMPFHSILIKLKRYEAGEGLVLVVCFMHLPANMELPLAVYHY